MQHLLNDRGSWLLAAGWLAAGGIYIKNEKREMKEEEKTTNHHLNRFFSFYFSSFFRSTKTGGEDLYSVSDGANFPTVTSSTPSSLIFSTTGLFSNLVSEKARQKQEHKQPSWLRQRGWFYSSSQLFSVYTFPPTKCQVRVSYLIHFIVIPISESRRRHQMLSLQRP